MIDIWENSIRATHLFLTSKEIDKIKEYVEHLIIAYNNRDSSIAFMGVENKKIEMLFVKNNERGKGVGTKLIKYGITNILMQIKNLYTKWR